MKALLLENVGEIAVREVPVPGPRDAEVLLKTKSAAICRTDAKMWKTRHRDLVLPRVLGHEFCGVDEKSGERYVVWPGNACGHCGSCSGGFENLCDEMRITGFHRDGGLAEYALVDKSCLVPVPEDLPDEVVCLAEPAACTLNGVKMAGVKRGDKVLVYGGGPVGLLMALAVKSLGADPTVCEINPDKIELSLDFQKAAGVRVCDRLPEGGYHVAINATPSLEAFQQGIEKLLTGGCFCIFSGFTDSREAVAKEIVNVLNEIHYRQLRVTSAYGCTREQMRLAVEMIGGHGDAVSSLISETISLEDAPSVLPEIWAGNALRYVVKFE